MKKIVPLSVLVCTLTLQLQANDIKEQKEQIVSVEKNISSMRSVPHKEIDVVSGLQHMFSDGKVTGQIRSMMSAYDNKTYQSVLTTAVGGSLKYELAEYKGLSAGVTFHSSNDITVLSAKGTKRNTDLSSTQKEYEVRSETYLNYSYDAFNVRIGRQILDTPLADSDDIAMVPNSFKAGVVSYKNEDLHVTLGVLKSWQGCDADLDGSWQKTGKDSTYFVGMTYAYDTLEANLWFYNINGEAGDMTANNSFYIDVANEFQFNDSRSLHVGLQYLKQNELDESGVSANIFGITTEFVIDDFGLNFSYNHAGKESAKQSFSGFGGGTLFTSMDSMILDTITYDRSVNAYVAGINYTMDNFNFLYAYGDFKGNTDSSGVKAEITEHNFGVEYSKTDDFSLAVIYTLDNDKYDNSQNGANGGDWRNLRIFGAYNF